MIMMEGFNSQKVTDGSKGCRSSEPKDRESVREESIFAQGALG